MNWTKGDLSVDNFFAMEFTGRSLEPTLFKGK